MNRTSIFAVSIAFFLLLNSTNCDEEEAKTALTNFITKLTKSSGASLWNLTSEPCKDGWQGVACDSRGNLKNITLNGHNFSGNFDASLLCNVQSIVDYLTVLSLNDNNLQGESLENVANCTQLTRLFLRRNRFSGSLPDSFSRLNNLKQLDISENNFSGILPNLSRISGLTGFSAQDNHFSGAIPNFEFSNFVIFNISNNNFSGTIPSGGDRFPATSFSNNPLLCDKPLTNNCSALPSEEEEEVPDSSKHGPSTDEILMFSGYFLMGLTLLIVIILWLCRKKKKEEDQVEAVAKLAAVDDSMTKPGYTPTNFKNSTVSKSDISAVSGDHSAFRSSSLVVLTSPEVNGLKFENLLKAPAELLGRGKHGSVYKVFCEDLGMSLAVKRIKDWIISSNDFKQRMRRLGQLKHPNVLPALAFYSSRQEKLLVYEYQENGSLFRFLHGNFPPFLRLWTTQFQIRWSEHNLLEAT